MPVGDRIAARAYQLTEEDAAFFYPSLMKDIEPYLEKIGDPTKRLLIRRSLRIFLRFLSEDGMESLKGSIASSEDIDGKALESAVTAFYPWIAASSAYSELSSLRHAMIVGHTFRWLGKAWPRRYPTLKRIQFQPKKLGSSRRNTAVQTPVVTMLADEIANVFGRTLADDLAGIAAEKGAKYTQGFRLAISWAWHKRRSQSSMVISALRQEPGSRCDPAVIKELLDDFEKEMEASKAYSPRTVSGQKRSAARVFEALSQLPERSYPEYLSRYTKSTHVPVPSRTLADVYAEECSSREEAARLRQSIDLVREAAMDVLKLHVSVFNALGPAREQCLDGIIEPDRREALGAISVLLQAEMKSLRQTGHSQFSTRGVRFDRKTVDDALEAARRPETWRLAGVSAFLPNKNILSLQEVRALLVYGIGASRAACLAAKVVFCCETAWNRSSIDRIPSQPFVFKIDGQYGIASAAFLAVFKKRAGHDVVALLERRTKLGETARDNIWAVWEEAEREGRWKPSDGRCSIDADSTAYEALELIRPLVSALDDFKLARQESDRFFKFLKWEGGVTIDDGEIGFAFKEGPLSKPGVTFPVIRKTVLQLKLRKVGSVEGLRAGAGHAGTQVLMPYYLNSPHLIRELEQSTRFFQNALQAIVGSEVGPSLQVVMSPEDQEWFYNLARASGVASAVGYDVSVPFSGASVFTFEPTNDSITELLSLELSLARQEAAASPRLWSLVGIPLTGYVKAIRAWLREVGLDELVTEIEKQLLSDVDEGRTVLQKIF